MSIIEAMNEDELRNYVAMQKDLERALDEAMMEKDCLIEVLFHLIDVERREQDALKKLIAARKGEIHMDKMMIEKYSHVFSSAEQ